MQVLPAPGSEITIRGTSRRVVRAARHGGIIEIHTADATFFWPFERIDSPKQNLRVRWVRRRHWLARVTHARATAESFELPLAALTAPIDIMSHQLEPYFAAAACRRRILIADDVGLGKTIQAGLIVAESIRRGMSTRVLILTPSNLAAQWQTELRNRFGIDARIVDAESLRRRSAELPRNVNPWLVDAVAIASIDFVKQEHVLAALPDAPWDIAIVDEAHTVVGDSARHDAALAILTNAHQVILLTATPHSGDESSAARLRQLGALGPHDDVTVFRRMRLDIGPAPLRRVRRVVVPLQRVERQTLDLIGRFDRLARAESTMETRESTELLLAILSKRALSTFGALRLTLDRRLAFLDNMPATDQRQLTLAFGDDEDEPMDMRCSLPVDRERAWLRRLRVLAVASAKVEAKIERLRRLLARTTEPAIVFTEFRDSLAIVADVVGGVASVSVAHGGLSGSALDQALSAFQMGRSRVLVATDVASQGLNLQQRCRWVIHLDRPWNPVRLEQRAGRVDRLGQVRDVHVTELMTSHDREFELAERVGRRAQAAATSGWLRPCDRYRRRGRAAARVLTTRRRMAAIWRGPAAGHGGRPVAQRSATATSALWRTDLRDRDGRVRESLIWRGEWAGPPAHPPRAHARQRRLARQERARVERQTAMARAVGARHRRPLAQLPLPALAPARPDVTPPPIAHAETTVSTGDQITLSPPILVAVTLAD